jgi:acyl-CoA thioesterase II
MALSSGTRALARLRSLGTSTSATHHRLRPQPSVSGCNGESQLDLHQLDSDLFLAKRCSLWVPPGGRGVFGGQVVGQALHAATLTVGTDRVCHSLHSYFLLPGDPTRDVIYRIHRSSDRRSFTTRSVEAIQRGKIIFQAEMSFCNAAEKSAMHHQKPMPDVPPPESLRSHLELLEEILPSLPAAMHEPVLRIRSMPVDMRFVHPPDLLDPNPPPRPPLQHIWMRITQPLDPAPRVHRACAAYFSDHALLTTALRPHGINFPSPRLGAVASLDHSMWFHTSAFRADEWMLYELHSPWAGHGRALSFGHLFERSTGTLHVTCAQEGVIRLAKPSSRKWLGESLLWGLNTSRRLKSWFGWSSAAAASAEPPVSASGGERREAEAGIVGGELQRPAAGAVAPPSQTKSE